MIWNPVSWGTDVTEELARYFDGDGELFEKQGVSNGGKHWMARQLMAMLGYDSFEAFSQAINRAIGTCTTLGIPVLENFQQTTSGDGLQDYKLSRFACYLVAMNGDIRKPYVAAAQAYFATLAEAAHRYIQDANNVERVQIRGEVSEREKSLSSTAKAAGVENYAYFQNAGYRGMYNMDLWKLKKLKGLPKGKTLLDFMDKRELAGNLFRLTETDAKLKNDNVRGQKPAENVAEHVGKKVRSIMIENGTRPEMIPLAGDIKKVRSGLIQTLKGFLRLDRPKE
jgi:DNA-damage-inducible protein D